MELEGLNEATAGDEETIKAIKVGKEKYLTMSLIRASDRSRYSRLMDDLQTQFTMGYNNFPTHVTAAYNLIINKWVTGQSTELSMTRKGWHLQQSRKALHSQRLRGSRRNVITPRSNVYGTRREAGNEEDKTTEEGGEVTEALQQLFLAEPPDSYETYDEVAFHQPHRHVNPNWVILDTGSTSDIFYNKKLVSIIWLSRDSLKVHCNAGTKVVKHVAKLNNYGTAWFNEQGIANILSMSMVKKKFPVRYEIAKSEQFVVSKPEKGFVFAAISNGLYYHDTTNRAVVMVTTVRGIEKDSPIGSLENQKRHKDPSA
jgi:hypothetical protein